MKLQFQIGPSSCGKTSVVKLLADLTGNELHVLPMNSAMDTTELLGGFEQASVVYPTILENIGHLNATSTPKNLPL